LPIRLGRGEDRGDCGAADWASMREPRVFDHIVSLGYHCGVAFNLRRTFGFETAYPLDWWVTPLQGLNAFLADPSLQRLYDPALLEPMMADGGIHAIRNVHYDIQLDHEFPRGGDGQVREDWLDHLGQARERTGFLLDRLLGLPAGSRVLFVRWTKGTERRLLGETFRPLMREAIGRLDRLFPRLQRTVLLIDPPRRVEEPAVINMRIDDPETGWRGTPELWTERLLRMGLARAGGDPDARPVSAPENDHAYLAQAPRAGRTPAA
jgi:hypothetical protein